MFNDSNKGQTQYCEECQKWAEKYEKLKQQLEIDKNQINYFIEENERLSELTCVNCGEKFLSPTGSELYEENVHLKAENKKLLQTLQKIKEIAENRTNYPCDKCIKTEILQKITKAEEE